MRIIWSQWELKWLASCRTNPITAPFCNICISWSTRRKEHYSTFTARFLSWLHERLVAPTPTQSAARGSGARLVPAPGLFRAAVYSHKVHGHVPTHHSRATPRPIRIIPHWSFAACDKVRNPRKFGEFLVTEDAELLHTVPVEQSLKGRS